MTTQKLFECVACKHLYQGAPTSECDCGENPENQYREWIASPAPAPNALDAAFEAVRMELCKLPKYSFVHSAGAVRSLQDTSGNWIEFDEAHKLLDPVAVDAAIAAQSAQGGV